MVEAAVMYDSALIILLLQGSINKTDESVPRNQYVRLRLDTEEGATTARCALSATLNV